MNSAKPATPAAPAGAAEVVREFFEATKAELRGIRDQDRAAVKAARQRLLDGVVSAETLRSALRAKFASLSEEKAETAIAHHIDSLQSTVAYYINGVELDRVAWSAVPKAKARGEFNMVEALVPASAKGRSVTFAVLLAETKSNEWRVQTVTFVPPDQNKLATPQSKPAARE